MAKTELKILTLPLLAITLLTVVNGYGTIGGKMPIHDAKTNKVIQALGAYAVDAYNEGHLNNGGDGLAFSRVVKAEKQVVSGMKYFLKIEATENGQKKMFDSVVLVKPWSSSEEKELISFSASTQQPGVVAKPPSTR